MNEISTRRHTVSSAGASAGLAVTSIRGSRPGLLLAVLGGIHGDEWEGVAAVGQLCRLLRGREIRGEVRLVAVCNEPAFEASMRRSPIDALDLARSFPGDPAGSVTQQLAALITREVIQPADFLVDLHSAGLHYTMPTLVGFMGGDTALARMSYQAALCFGASVTWRHPPPPPAGRTLSVAHEHGIPWIYAETTGAGGLRRRDVKVYTCGVLNVMRSLGMLSGNPPKAQPATRLAGSGDLDQATVRAQHAGILLSSVDLLEPIHTGDVIGAVVDRAGEVIESLIADRAGVVVMLRHTPRVDPGDTICHLADKDDVSELG